MNIRAIFHHPKKQLFIIVSGWMLAQLICFFLWGTQTGLESIKYISAAEHFLQNGSFPEKRYWFYSVTVFVIVFAKWLNMGFGFVFFVQLLTSLFAHLSFFRALRSQCRENHPAPLITTLVLCFVLPYQQWNFTLYTESLFYSFVLIFFSYCIGQNKMSVKIIVIQCLLISLVILSRPLGILILTPWILFLFFKVPGKFKMYFSLLILTGLILLIMISNEILSSISDWNVLRPFLEGSVICAMPLQEKALIILPTKETPVVQLAYLIKTYPKEFFLLSVEKTKAFFLMTRYYYSAGHNIVLILMSAVFYLPILFSLFRNKININFVFPLLIISFFYIAVILQCDDYHNRFVLTLVPVFLYAGVFRFLVRIVR